MDTRIRRTRPGGTPRVSVTLTVSAEVARGSVSAQELEQWVKAAVEKYHCFRAGHVGFDAQAAIRVPSLTAHQED